MSCNYPITAYRCPIYHTKTGKLIKWEVVFQEKQGDAVHVLRLPCGNCDGCRMERSRQWAVRVVHESKLWNENSYITLTYNNEHLPDSADLLYDDFQKFMKRFRKKYSYALPTKKHHGPRKQIRFFMCGEYGDLGRPHFHACIFNHSFDDRVYFKTNKNGDKIYTSKQLEDLWSDSDGNSMGFCTVGDISYASAAYVARYVMKKRRGGEGVPDTIDMETGEIVERNDEFVHMSLKPGIGYEFYRKFKSDIYPHDYVWIDGKTIKPPKYYTKKLSKEDENCYNLVQEKRALKALGLQKDNTEDRLIAKEKVLKARNRFLKRELS